MVVSCCTQLLMWMCFPSNSNCIERGVNAQRSNPVSKVRQGGTEESSPWLGVMFLPCPSPNFREMGSALSREELPWPMPLASRPLAWAVKTMAVLLLAFPQAVFFICFSPSARETCSPPYCKYAKYDLNTFYVFCLGTHQ